MSNTIPNINLATSVSPITIVPPGGLQASQISWIEFQNISPYDCTLVAGSVNIPIAAWDDFYYQVTDIKHQIIAGFSLPIMLEFMIIGTLASNISTTLRVTFYSLGETPTNTQSRQLVRQTWTPNTVNTVGGTASSVQNDGNPAGTSVVEATVLGDSASAVSLTNQGHLVLGTFANNGTFQLIGSLGNVTIASTGALTVDDIINFNQATAEAGNDFGITVAAGQKIVHSVTGTGHIFDVNASGMQLLIGTLSLLSGSLARVSVFTATVSTTPTLFNHGLGAVPDIVLISVNGTGVGTFTCIYDVPSLTSTQVKLTGSANLSVTCIAIKQ